MDVVAAKDSQFTLTGVQGQRVVDQAFRELRKLLGHVQRVRESVDASDPDDPRGRLASILRADARVLAWLDKYRGPEGYGSEKRYTTTRAQRNSLVLAFAKWAYGEIGDSALDRIVDTHVKTWVVNKTLSDARKDLRQGVPDELLEFLPQNLAVEVDPNGRVRKFEEVLGNQQRTISAKISRQHQLLSRYNEAMKRVNRDLKSPDPVTRLSATIVGIIMETGIRPGNPGTPGLVISKRGGETVEIETFGASTLLKRHIPEIRKSFARLEFPGKMGAVNIAEIHSKEIVAALRSYLIAAKRPEDPIFVATGGQTFTKHNVNNYMKSLFGKETSVTDFRKLKATESVFETLLEEQEELYRRIRLVVDHETGALEKRVVEEIRAVVLKAVQRAQNKLSHDDYRVTVDQYINPQLILKFLHRGGISSTLKEAILKGEDRVTFDLEAFMERASARSVAASVTAKCGSLQSVLDEAESVMDDFGVEPRSRKASQTPEQRIRASLLSATFNYLSRSRVPPRTRTEILHRVRDGLDRYAREILKVMSPFVVKTARSPVSLDRPDGLFTSSLSEAALDIGVPAESLREMRRKIEPTVRKFSDLLVSETAFLHRTARSDLKADVKRDIIRHLMSNTGSSVTVMDIVYSFGISAKEASSLLFDLERRGLVSQGQRSHGSGQSFIIKRAKNRTLR